MSPALKFRKCFLMTCDFECRLSKRREEVGPHVSRWARLLADTSELQVRKARFLRAKRAFLKEEAARLQQLVRIQSKFCSA